MAKSYIVMRNATGMMSSDALEKTLVYRPAAVKPIIVTGSPYVIDQGFDFQTGDGAAVSVNLGGATRNDIEDQHPVAVEPIEKNVTVAERLGISPAQNAHQYSVSGLRDLVHRLIGLNPSDRAFGGVNLRDIAIAGYVNKQNGGSTPATLGELIDGGGPDNADKFHTSDAAVSSVVNAAANNTMQISDQAQYFYRAVTVVDYNILILRQVEKRISQYKALLEEARALQSRIADEQLKAQSRLNEVTDELVVARHHLSMVRQLKHEEELRIAGINAKREAILDKVDVVIFHKPRLTDRFTRLPVIDAASAELDGKPQITLRNLDGVPQDLTEMVQNFRKAPLSWFRSLAGLPQFFDRPAMLFTAFEHVRLRSEMIQSVGPETPPSTSTFAASARRIIGLQAEQSNAWRQLGRTLDTQTIDMDGLVACHRRLRQAATLGDMIDGGHGSAKASKSAVAQLDLIEQAAESLYASFAEAPARLRLGWAEALMDGDGQLTLRDLHSLSDWLTLGADMCREQQGLVDILYQQIEQGNADAETAINRLILVALLVACHAPVTQLVGARMVRAVAAQPGVIFDLDVDIAKARVGMPVTIQNEPGSFSARAVVDDIVGGRARARILETLRPNITLAADAIVQLSDAPAFSMSAVRSSMVQLR